jgi:hypothetical protein
MEYITEHGPGKPVMIMCTSVIMATSMAVLLKRELPGDIEADKVLLLTGATQTSENANVTAFLSDPTQEVEKYHVIIATPTLQAGHSIEKHIGKSPCDWICINGGMHMLISSDC